MPIALLDWRKSKLVMQKDGRWTAVETYNVTPAFPGEVLDKTAALAVCPQPGNAHPASTYLIVTSPDADSAGQFGTWIVTIPYEITSWVNTDTTGNPLVIANRLRWMPATKSLAIDADCDGNRIVNSANDTPSTPPTDDVPTFFFEVTRAEPYFYAATSALYMNKVSSADVTIAGIGSIPAGNLFCHFVGPQEEFFAASNFVLVTYRFEINPDGFDLRLPDVGRRAYTDDGYIGQIVDAGNNPVAIDVALDGQGGLHPTAELDGYYVMNADGVAVGSSDNGTPAGATVDNTSSASTFLRWKKKKTVDFNLLSL